ncbi:CG34396 [Drosophila busckii]|uniref:CG34396 n=1 Tax=Drosophila busckii TaxID=30019 RepID=A0A0M4EM50_DROBS|nr:uncharacterized protein LOC108597748 isoform X1 [Drosophila busckii]ALC42780.1 CG34396 [Drosophila busckii]
METTTDEQSVGASRQQQLRQRRQRRSQREQTPDASKQYAKDNAEPQAQHIRMQIRPPGALSAHESKILRRRDKSFASSAQRSQSQPREAEKLSNPLAQQLMKQQRSLSSPRHKEESSESELTGSSQSYTQQQQQQQQRQNETLTRLEQNMQRFEDERRRFETEKRLFEREKREHKVRHRQQLDYEERKRLLQSYRKISDSFQLPQDEQERQRLVQSLRLQRHEAPTVRMRNRSSGYEESSTQFSSSDADTAEELTARHKPAYIAAIRGAPPPAPLPAKPEPPPQPPERRAVSRNNSLSPVRPQRRSKTPEQRAEQQLRKSEYIEVGETRDVVDCKPKLSERQQRDELHKAYMEASARAAAAEAALAKSLRRSNSLKLPEEQQQPSKQESKRSSSLERVKRAKRTPSLERPKLEKPCVPDEPAMEEPAAEPLLVETEISKPPTLLQRLFRRQPKAPPTVDTSVVAVSSDEPVTRSWLWHFCSEAAHEWRRLKLDYPQRLLELRQVRNVCFSHTILLTLLLGFGGLVFRYTEGTSENIYKCEVRKVKRDFIDNLWDFSHNMREDDWKSLARTKLRKFEDELNNLAELGLRRYPGQKSFNFVNCIIFCWTVITTIGYGHITPKTPLGRALTIVYAIIGIPMFLIVLADLGKLFTRSIKFLWAYVRRLYYTRSCRRIRHQQQYRDAMTGFNTVYDMAIRRPSQFFGMMDAESAHQDAEAGKSLGTSHPETPTSPYPETFEVDDEFNLPVSVATILLIIYLLLGSAGYTVLEHPNWTFMDAFYYVFISMSTIGFGDLVPSNPFFMMISMIYLMFGLALTSMFINVVQIKLSDHFKRASAKVRVTIGMASEFGDGSQVKTPSEMASVHGSRLGRNEEDGNGITAATPPPLTSILRPARPLSPAFSNMESPPPLMPRRQELQPPTPAESEKKKKHRFF